MKRIPEALLEEMAEALGRADRDEMALPSYLHSNPLLRWMAWRRVELVVRALEGWAETCRIPIRDRTVLDFGCGTGVLFPSLARQFGRIYGIDPVLTAARMMVQCSGLDQISLLSPEEAQSLPEGAMDVIICAEVLEHVRDLEETIPFLRRRLKSDGLLLVSLPTENFLYRLGRRLAGFSGHYHHHRASSVDPVIRRLGFRRHRLIQIPLPGPFSVYWIIQYVKAPSG